MGACGKRRVGGGKARSRAQGGAVHGIRNMKSGGREVGGRGAYVHAWVPREVVGRACGVGVVGARTSRSVWVWVDFQVWLDFVL